MCGLLQRILDAGRERDCPIVHIGALENAEPFVAATPCRGDSTDALIEISREQYLALAAEIWGMLVVEYDRELPMPVHVGGSATGGSARVALTARTIAGFLRLPLVTAGVQYTLDSYGQETIILYRGLESFADIQRYWTGREAVVRAFRERYSANALDLDMLLSRLDRTVRPHEFDLETFAAERGVSRAVNVAIR
jgi:hypothetical protein